MSRLDPVAARADRARLDPSTLGEFPCLACGETFLAVFLLLEHRRRWHGAGELVPLALVQSKDTNNA